MSAILSDDPAERVLLSAIMANGFAALPNNPVICTDWFENPTHRLIFGAAHGLYREDKPTNFIAISRILRASGLLSEAGGDAYITNVSGESNFPGAVESAFQSLSSRWQDRTTRTRLRSALARIDAGDDPGAVIENVSQLGAEFAEDSEFPPVDWGESSANSANSAGGYEQEAILPGDSILEDWFHFAAERTEGAACYLAGSILPIVAAILGRRVWMHLGDGPKYPNIFSILVGKPGDRKSTTIRLVACLARKCLPSNAFVPASFSPESLFDEYDEAKGGVPDKLLIEDDANVILGDWAKSQNGERNAARFLKLYDCGPLSETFRRNAKESETKQGRREIPATSTSVLFGATFNVAAFQGQAVRAGMARRFCYYVAERRGRDLLEGTRSDLRALEDLADAFNRCSSIAGQMHFSTDARRTWLEFQQENRAMMDSEDPLKEGRLARLSSIPAQALAIAMIFEAGIWAKRSGPWTGELSSEALVKAIEHANECLSAADVLDTIGERATIQQNAEILFEAIVRDFAGNARGGTISDLSKNRNLTGENPQV